MLLLDGCTAAPALNVGMPASAAAGTDPYSARAAGAVVDRFLTQATAGHGKAALTDRRAGLMRVAAPWGVIARYGLVAMVAAATAAGAGRRSITVPFRVGRTSGSAVLTGEIEADDPGVHDWSIRSIAFPAGRTTR